MNFTKLVKYMFVNSSLLNEAYELTNLVEVYLSLILDGSSTLPSSTILFIKQTIWLVKYRTYLFFFNEIIIKNTCFF